MPIQHFAGIPSGLTKKRYVIQSSFATREEHTQAADAHRPGIRGEKRMKGSPGYRCSISVSPTDFPRPAGLPACLTHPSRCLCLWIHRPAWPTRLVACVCGFTGRPAPPVSLPVPVDSPPCLHHPSRCLCLWIHRPACPTRLVFCVCGFTCLPAFEP